MKYIIFIILLSYHLINAQNTFVSAVSNSNPCCVKPTTSPCTPHPSCNNNGPSVEAEEAMPSNNDDCNQENHDNNNGCGDKLRKSADDIDKKLNKDVVTPGMKRMEEQYRRKALQRKRDQQENDKKRKRLATKLSKQTKAKIALDRVEQQLDKQLQDIHSTQQVLKMQMTMTKNQLKNQNLDVAKVKLPKMSVMSTLKKMHKRQAGDLGDNYKDVQGMVKKGLMQATASFGAGRLNGKQGNKIKKQQVKKAKKLLKKIKKQMKK